MADADAKPSQARRDMTDALRLVNLATTLRGVQARAVRQGAIALRDRALAECSRTGERFRMPHAVAML